MVYEFNERTINLTGINDFFNKNKFVGYILPNGEIFRCKKHNEEDVDAIIHMYVYLLKEYYNDRDKFLDNKTNNKLIEVVIDYFKKIDYEQVLALNDFLNKKKRAVSELMVQLFGCHLVTRMVKRILTSESNHYVFYNYLLNGFKIDTIDKIVYNKEKKEYEFLTRNDRNDYLYDEIETILKDTDKNDIDLFYRK